MTIKKFKPKKVKLPAAPKFTEPAPVTPYIQNNTGRNEPYCYVCNERISSERIKALIMLNCPSNMWTHVKCSTTGKIKGIYEGEAGTSRLILADRVYNDSVRSIFHSAEAEKEKDEPKDSE